MLLQELGIHKKRNKLEAKELSRNSTLDSWLKYYDNNIKEQEIYGKND